MGRRKKEPMDPAKKNIVSELRLMISKLQKIFRKH